MLRGSGAREIMGTFGRPWALVLVIKLDRVFVLFARSLGPCAHSLARSMAFILFMLEHRGFNAWAARASQRKRRRTSG